MFIPDAKTLQNDHVKQKRDDDTYNLVLQRCIEKIIYVNKMTEKTYTIFEVPMFILGKPLYNVTQCVMYIIERLSQKNYATKFLEPNYLHIDWSVKKNFNNNSQYIKKLLEKYPGTTIDFVYK